MSRSRQAAAITLLVSAALGFGGWATSAEGAHPQVAGALYALTLLTAVGALALIFVPPRRNPVRLEEWRQQEDRFRSLNKNVSGHWSHEAGSRVLRWSVWPSEGGTARDREAFEGEAQHASRLLKRALGYPDDKYVAWFGSNEVDQWLTAIRSLVHAGTDMKTSGVDFGGQKSVGHHIEELPVMSAVACVKLAAGTRPRVGVPATLE